MRVTYGEVTALDALSIAFPRGAIHAVVGQNGAGKTTFARVAAGLVRPDAGSLDIDGRPLRLGRVAGARAAGVELVHQSFALPPSFTVAEALEFGAGGGIGLYGRRQLLRRCRERLAALDLDVDPRRRIRDLPVEAQQGVEIARALVTDAKLLILDEPTAVLPPSGIEALFERIRGLRRHGVTVILILHKIREVLAVADTVSVLRGGRLVAGPIPREGADEAGIAQMIIGGAEVASADGDDTAALVGARQVGSAGARGTREEPPPAAREAVLSLASVSTAKEPEEPALDRVSLSVAPGEIVGVAGVQGNGQRTLVKTIAGLADAVDGDIRLGGSRANRASPAQRRALGLRVIPFERNSEGLSLTSALWENWSVRELMRRPLLSLVDPAALRRQCDKSLKAWGVHYAHAAQNAGALSGGNAQKVILAREIDADARLIIAAQPARGLDIGATAFVWSALREAAGRGCGVLLISSDLDELFDISDRLVVMLSGGIAGTFAPPYDLAAVGRAMTGASA
ncbi:MAG: ATP-binding cassette domain-containing protein [Rhodospirillales bacterium]|nr:ATP-binding cassette domain-containing protein [Rhodospirillales bacterium]